MLYYDTTLPSFAENLALEEALLNEAEGDRADCELLRVWQPGSPTIVLGRSSKVNVEVDRGQAAASNVPIFRRVSGGATIVAAGGCLFYALLISLSRRPQLRMLDEAHRFVMAEIASSLQPLVPKIGFDGTCDLVVGKLKVGGNSVRVVRNWMLYHGTILLNMDLSLVDRLLQHPPREPAYRQGRSHSEFLANLNLGYSIVCDAMRQQWQATERLQEIPHKATEQLVIEKYACDAWNLQR